MCRKYVKNVLYVVFKKVRIFHRATKRVQKKDTTNYGLIILFFLGRVIKIDVVSVDSL